MAVDGELPWFNRKWWSTDETIWTSKNDERKRREFSHRFQWASISLLWLREYHVNIIGDIWCTLWSVFARIDKGELNAWLGKSGSTKHPVFVNEVDRTPLRVIWLGKELRNAVGLNKVAEANTAHLDVVTGKGLDSFGLRFEHKDFKAAWETLKCTQVAPDLVVPRIRQNHEHFTTPFLNYPCPYCFRYGNVCHVTGWLHLYTYKSKFMWNTGILRERTHLPSHPQLTVRIGDAPWKPCVFVNAIPSLWPYDGRGWDSAAFRRSIR